MRLELAPDIGKRLRAALREAKHREIGGMLFAEQLAPSHFRIMDFSVDANSGTHTNFRREPARHRAALDEFFARTGYDFSRFNYLGEWHSHPSFAVRPSLEDLTTMTELIEYPEISFAVLLIVRLRFWFWTDYSLTLFARGHPPRPIGLTRRCVRIPSELSS